MFIYEPIHSWSILKLLSVFVDPCQDGRISIRLWILHPDPPLYPLHFLFQYLIPLSSVMPYLRPDRKGLPDPPSEDGENSGEMPRSESYLHLSDLGDASTSSQVDAVGPSQPVFQLIDTEPIPLESGKIRVVTPPDDTSSEHAPTKQAPPSFPSSGNMEKLRAADSPKHPPRRLSKSDIPQSLSPQDVSLKYLPQMKGSCSRSPEPTYQSPKVDPWMVISLYF